MAGTLAFSIYLDVSTVVLAIQAMVMLGVGTFILSRPDGPGEDV
jgi:hypothetical protein